MTTMIHVLYLCVQCVDNARVEEDHQHERQKISNQKQEKRDRLLLGDAVVDAPRYTDSINDVRAETCHQYLHSWDEKPDGEYDRDICHARFDVLLYKQDISM